MAGSVQTNIGPFFRIGKHKSGKYMNQQIYAEKTIKVHGGVSFLSLMGHIQKKTIICREKLMGSHDGLFSKPK